jgi:ABC-type branched-subunit amino acid transport system ATPase component
MADARHAAPILEVKGLDVYYGSSHALQGVDLTLDSGVLSVVGRNGMGKTTLCKTIMGLVRATGGSVRVSGEDLLSLQPARIARLGVGYVPQGRRLWRSLTVDEHLRMIAGMRRGAWNVERIYDTFPRLAERKNNGGAQLSGGEQQMLAIGRALMARPRILLLDEPSMGLAPILVEQIFDTVSDINRQGTTILLVEQNAAIALSVAHRAYVLETGSIALSGAATVLAEHPDVQRAYLGETA